MKRKRNIQQLQQQVQQNQDNYIGGDIPHYEDIVIDNIENDELNSVDIPVITPSIPVVETSKDVNETFVDEIIIPQTLEDKEQQLIVQQLVQKTNEEQIVVQIKNQQNEVVEQVTLPKRLSKFKETMTKLIKPIITHQQIQQQNNDLPSQVNQDIVNSIIEETHSQVVVESVEDVNQLIDTIEEVSEVITNIPEAEDLSIDDLVIVDNSKVKGDKTGYKKFKVTVKNDKYGGLISNLATQTKKDSKGIVEHRVSDLRVIGNTNSKFLSGNELQLAPIAFTFKPKGGIVNKSTRIIVSIPESYDSDGHVNIFIQKSRDKDIYRVPLITPEDIEWLSKFMSNYFNMTFKMANSLLNLQDRSNPLNEIIRILIQTGSFKVLPIIESNNMKGFVVKSSMGGNTEWLKVHVVRSTQTPTEFVIYLMSSIDDDWYKYVQPNGKREVSFKYLQDNLLSLLLNLFSKDDWTEYGLDLNDEDVKDEIMMSKITYRKLKAAYIELFNKYINEGSEDDTEEKIGLVVTNTLSQADTKKAIGVDSTGKSYAAESILGKTDKLKYFILTYLGVQIVGGDKRHGGDYITNQEYYQKYSVRDKRDYNQRQRTVLKKDTGEDRNYNARIFMFQIEYQIGTNKYVYKSKDFEDIKQTVGLLTNSPQPTNIVE